MQSAKLYPRLEKRKAKRRLAKYGKEILTDTEKKIVQAAYKRDGYFEPSYYLTDDGMFVYIREPSVASLRATGVILANTEKTNTTNNRPKGIPFSMRDLDVLRRAHIRGDLPKTFQKIMLENMPAYNTLQC